MCRFKAENSIELQGSYQLFIVFSGVIENKVGQELAALVLFLGRFREIATSLPVSIVVRVVHLRMGGGWMF